MQTLSELVGQRMEIVARCRLASTKLAIESERLHQLIASCRAAQGARRESRDAPPAVARLFTTDRVQLGDVEVVVARQSLRDAHGTRRLTPTEWQLLLFLLSNPDTVHTRSDLAAGAWGTGFDGRDTEVEVYISRLRRKLGSAAPLLETVRGQGYRFVVWGGDGTAGDAPDAVATA